MRPPVRRRQFIRLAVDEPALSEIDQTQLSWRGTRQTHISSMDVSVKDACTVQALQESDRLGASQYGSLHMRFWRVTIKASVKPLHHHEPHHAASRCTVSLSMIRHCKVNLPASGSH